jgi:hypothetical protein
MNEHLALLGFKVRDVVTGYEGVCESISFDLYGCIQGVVRPPVAKDKPDMPDGRWVDVKRLIKISDAPVMAAPPFAALPVGREIGGSEKPVQSEGRVR